MYIDHANVSSALLLLQRSDNLAPDRMLGGGYDDASIVEIISKHGDALAKSVLSSSSRPPEMISPFILHLLYQSATLTAKLCQERNQSIASLEDMKKALTTMGRRWHVASKYFAPPQIMYGCTNMCSRCLLSNPQCKGVYSFSAAKIDGGKLYSRNVTKCLCRICAARQPSVQLTSLKVSST